MRSGQKQDETEEDEHNELISLSPRETFENLRDVPNQTPIKRVLITRTSLASVKPESHRALPPPSRSFIAVSPLGRQATPQDPTREVAHVRQGLMSIYREWTLARAVPRPVPVIPSVSPSTKSETAFSRPISSSISTSTTTTTDPLNLSVPDPLRLFLDQDGLQLPAVY